MTRKSLVLAVVILMAAGAASAQEAVGAQRIELSSAVFGGGMLFMRSAVVAEPDSHSYVLNGAFTMNVNRLIGIEGDVSVALTRQQALSLYGVAPSDSRTPTMLFYGANVIYNPFASDRRVVPYVTGGLGGLTTFSGGASNFALAANTTYLTASIGGGARWFPVAHWGVRGDYRYVGIRNDASTPSAGRQVVRSAHRIFAALVYTF